MCLYFGIGITSIEPEWLPEFAAPYCNISEPLKDPPPYFDKKSGRVKCYINSSFGRNSPLFKNEELTNADIAENISV